MLFGSEQMALPARRNRAIKGYRTSAIARSTEAFVDISVCLVVLYFR